MQGKNGVSGVIKSQSTIQLMGLYHNAIGTMSPSSRQLSNQESDIDVLIDLSSALLKNVQLLRRIITQYTYGRIGRELQHLSLTVGAFERVLFTFIKEEVLDNSEFTDDSALKDALPLLDRSRRYPVLLGGIGALLRHGGLAFKDTAKVLEGLHASYDPLRKQKWTLGSIAMSFMGIVLARRYWKSTSIWNFWRKNCFNVESIKKIVLAVVLMDVYRRIQYRYSR